MIARWPPSTLPLLGLIDQPPVLVGLQWATRVMSAVTGWLKS